MTKTKLLGCTLVILLIPAILNAANWMHFIDSNNGDKNYIDTENIKNVSADVFRVMKKIEPGDSSKYSHAISTIDLDCKNDKMKILKETIYYDSRKPLTNTGNDKWQKINPDDMEELLIEMVCGLKKTPFKSETP